ncbi:hypothetical protein LIER_37060 [Lithospermum erythrorhizon]|uniref:Uncharacterized protein n=1 Tax=Lithospermum erythrorhizon TaxID=34254 RepID=A0AAV3PGN0_LITER
MTMRLEERYHDFMYGLNHELNRGSIRYALNTQESLPSLDTAYQKIREEESMRKANDTPIGWVSGLVGDTNHRGPRTGAVAGNRDGAQVASGGGAALHAVFSEPPEASHGIDPSRFQGGSGAAFPSMSQDQWQRLMSLIGNPDTPSSSSDCLMGKSTISLWIFDTWATVHATGTLVCLVDQFDYLCYPCLLPGDRVICSTRRDTVMLSSSLTLRDVLSVPNLHCIGNATELASCSSSVHFDIPEQSSMADGIFFGLDEYMEPAVGLDELAGASVEPLFAFSALDGAASPPLDKAASSPVEGAPSEAATPSAEAVVPPTEADLGRGRRERAPRRHLQDYVLNGLRHSSPPLSSTSPYSSLSSGVEPQPYRQTLAEYRSLTTLTCELKWLTGLLMGLGVSSDDVVPLYSDSQSALHLAHNHVFHEQSKHIEMNFHFVRDAIQDGTIVVSHVTTISQHVDFFTKPLGKQRFVFLLLKLGICDLHAPT